MPSCSTWEGTTSVIPRGEQQVIQGCIISTLRYIFMAVTCWLFPERGAQAINLGCFLRSLYQFNSPTVPIHKHIATSSPFTMCTYGITRAVQGECTKQPQHQIETRLRKRCLQSPKPGPPCDNPAHDTALDQLPLRKGGACPACRDSGIALEVYHVKWVIQAIRYCHYTLAKYE